jgi:hypothetical protein
MKNKSFFLLLFLSISLFALSAENEIDSKLRRLDDALAKRSVYDAIKQQRIDSLVQVSYLSEQPYEIYKKLYFMKNKSFFSAPLFVYFVIRIIC